jgi:hypothetical protein
VSDNDEISKYEIALMAEILEFCENSCRPYIHDFELNDLASLGKNSVIVKDSPWKLHLNGYVEQNQWESNGVPTLWWKLTPKAMGALSMSIAKTSGAAPISLPSWVSKLADPELRSVLDEVYRARDSGFLMLPLIGARTAFDRAMYLKIGDPKGGFNQKLSEMKKAGLLDERGAKNLEPMIEAGNAAAHRGWIPTREILDAVIIEVEHQLHDWFLRDVAAALVRTATPKRGT